MVSIILPIYNAEPYLEACMQSIVSQSFKDWKCICVNDGSIDGSLTILQRWAAKDSRFRIYNQENQGPSVARNFGLNVAKGEYISFVDADDKLLPEYLQRLVSMMEQDNLDVAGCAYELSDSHYVKRYQFTVDRVFDFEQLIASNQKLQQSNDLCYLWRYMFRRSSVVEAGICFDERCSIGEDTIFVTDVLAHSRRIRLCNESLYLYTVNPNSIMHRKQYNSRMEESFQRMYDAKIRQIHEYKIDKFTNYSYGLAVAAVTQYIPKLMSNRELKGETKDFYIPAVLDLPFCKHAFSQIGWQNIYPSWREYMVYLAMKFRIMLVLKRYF